MDAASPRRRRTLLWVLLALVLGAAVVVVLKRVVGVGVIVEERAADDAARESFAREVGAHAAPQPDVDEPPRWPTGDAKAEQNRANELLV